MIVYRVEHPEEGVGPYNHPDVEDHWMRSMPGIHPQPWDDVEGWGEIDNHWEYIFGFRSKKYLRLWFPENYREQLDEHYGFKVMVYKVDEGHVMYGDKQVAFPKSARPVGQIDLSEIGERDERQDT